MRDDWLFLEDLDAQATLDFVRDAHGETLAEFAKTPEFSALQADIEAQLQDEGQIPFCQEHRARMYHFYQSAECPKGVYRVCSAASFRAGLPDWEVLFDVSDFDGVLDDDVYLDGVSHYVDKPQQVLLTLSVAGADTAYTLEFDLEKRALVEGGFHFPPGKSHIAWRDEDSVWVCPAWDERQLTASGYPREVWLMERGQSFEEALPVYRMDSDGVMVNAWRYLDAQGAPVDLIEAAVGFFTKDYFQVDGQGGVHLLSLPKDCEIVGYLAGQLLVQLRDEWKRANRIYPAGSLVSVGLSRGRLGEAQLLFELGASQALEGVETTRRFLVVSYLDNVNACLKAWRYAEGGWQEVGLPDLPAGAVEMTDQPWGGDVVYLAASHFTVPLTLYALDLNVMELSVLRRQPKQFDADGVEVSQFWAVSADGVSVPYFHVGKNALPDTPTLVYVYGGFGVSELPHYLGSVGRHWLAKGYSFVLANVRGGGEFKHWHKAAQGRYKHKSVDDLLAVVGDVCNRGLSSPAKIALQGGSNGGLVVASAFVREPENIGALVCEVPLTDMLRYTRLSAGASWIEEFGDPENEADYGFLAALSPYHNLGADVVYPPALITTSLSDDRVHPAHALKFYAKLRGISPQSWLFAPEGGGHTGNGTQEETAQELACVLRFLETVLVG